MATLVKQVEDLKRELKSAKMKITKLEKKANGTGPNRQAERLQNELEASRRECGQLVKNEAGKDLEINDLRDQAHHYQQLIAHTAHVTVWKVLE